MPNFATASALVETATKCCATADSSPSAARHHAARALGVRQRLDGRERLRRDDEQRLRGVEVARRLGEVVRVDVRDEAHRQVAVGVGLQRLVGHGGPEIGAADADVDDRRGCACPCGRARRPSARAPRTPTCGRAPRAPRARRRRRRRRASARAACRSATCSTARSSVMLMCSPRNIASRRCSSPHARARPTSSASVSSVTRCFDQSAYQPAASPQSRSPRAGILREERAQVDVLQRLRSAPRARSKAGSRDAGASASRRLLQVASEREAHGRERAVGEVALAARAEAREERAREHGHRRARLVRGLERPAALARVRDAPAELVERRLLVQRLGGQVEQPRRDDAAAAPDLGDRRRGRASTGSAPGGAAGRSRRRPRGRRGRRPRGCRMFRPSA